jgi:hypothetical protein
LALLLPIKQPTGRDLKIERQFNGRHGAVARNFPGGNPVYVGHRRSHDKKTGSVAKRIGGYLYDVTLADGSTREFRAKQMRLRSIHLTDDDFTAFSNAFNRPVGRRKLPMEKLGHLDEHAVDHKPRDQHSANSSCGRRQTGAVKKLVLYHKHTTL